mgnify:CR=1 FL=1
MEEEEVLLLGQFHQIGVETFGMAGPDIDRTLLISKESGLPTIISGGISGIGDCLAAAEATRNESPGIQGIITGKAIYEGRLDLVEAIEASSSTCCVIALRV